MKKRSVTRRDFLRTAAIAPFAGAAFAHSLRVSEKKEALRSAKVVLIRDENAVIAFKKPDPEVVRKMMDSAIAELMGESNAVDAWKKLVMPSDIVGIKSNVWRYIPTPKAVEEVIKQRVMDVGVPEENISITDRGVRQDPIFQKATALINARPGRTHHWSGIGGCIKNPITFSSQPVSYHGDSCADLARLWDDFNLKERTKLNVLVMLYPQFHGIGPHSYSDQYVWDYKGILVSQDPVAVDAVGLRIIQAKRREYFGKDLPMQTPAKHIRLADERHNLGISDPSKIELVKMGWEEDILI